MASHYLVSIIASRLEQFVEDLDREKLQVALWHGRLTLESARIKPEALERLDMPVKLLEGSIEKLEIQVSYALARTRR